MGAACPATDVVQRHITIAFTDIVGSTSLLAELGEAGYLSALRHHNAIVRRAAADHDGTLAKFLGDGWMIAFPGPADAVGFAVDCQRALARAGHTRPMEAVRVRIGIHTGTALEDEDELIGRDVVLADRLTRRADGGEIVASSPVRDALPGGRFTQGRIADLDGLGPEVVYRVLDEEAEA